MACLMSTEHYIPEDGPRLDIWDQTLTSMLSPFNYERPAAYTALMKAIQIFDMSQIPCLVALAKRQLETAFEQCIDDDIKDYLCRDLGQFRALFHYFLGLPKPGQLACRESVVADDGEQGGDVDLSEWCTLFDTPASEETPRKRRPVAVVKVVAQGWALQTPPPPLSQVVLKRNTWNAGLKGCNIECGEHHVET